MKRFITFFCIIFTILFIGFYFYLGIEEAAVFELIQDSSISFGDLSDGDVSFGDTSGGNQSKRDTFFAFAARNDDFYDTSWEEEGQKFIRVLLRTDDYKAYYHTDVRFTCDYDFRISFEDVSGETILQKTAGEVVSYDKSWGNACVKPNKAGGRIKVLSINRNQGHPSYYGSLFIEPNTDGFVLINEVDVEHYLYGVVGSEMPANYPKDALKAQAICARTYAYQHIFNPEFPEWDAHLDDSTAFQVYQNSKEDPRIVEAVEETKNLVLCDGDKLIDAYYYSTSCGIGGDESAFNPFMEEDMDEHLVYQRIRPNWSMDMVSVYGEDSFTKFIKSVDVCDYEAKEPWYRWQCVLALSDEDLLFDKLKERYRKNPAHILTYVDGNYVQKAIEKPGKIRAIKVARRSDYGMVQELIIQGEKNTYKVISESDIRYVLCNGKNDVLLADQNHYTCKALLPSAYFIIEEDVSSQGAGFVLYGGGFGHSVGMSQNGAKNMAELGMDANQILVFFYQNAKVKKVMGD